MFGLFGYVFKSNGSRWWHRLIIVPCVQSEPQLWAAPISRGYFGIYAESLQPIARDLHVCGLPYKVTPAALCSLDLVLIFSTNSLLTRSPAQPAPAIF